MEDANRELCSDEDGISNILVDYYQQLFTSSNTSMIKDVVAHIPCSITDELNVVLFADVTEAVLSCLSTRVIPSSLNSTFITLIPKVKSPTKVSEFRSISLCNIVYKLVSKVVANGMRGLLPLIILES